MEGLDERERGRAAAGALVVIRRTEISKLAYQHQVPERTIQKDYVITCVLREIGPRMPELSLRFKGGTCLKKCHFEEYRYSEDLDFTAESPDGAGAIVAALVAVSEALTEQDLPVDLGAPDERGTGFTYFAKVTGPLGSEDRLKIDVTTQELLVFGPAILGLIDDYSDTHGPVDVRCYSLEEVFLEKLLCLLDRKRIQPRDLYDLNQLIENGGVDVESVSWHFSAKAGFKNLDPSQLRAEVERKGPMLRRDWDARLAEQVPKGSLPGYDDAERKLLRLLREHGMAR